VELGWAEVVLGPRWAIAAADDRGFCGGQFHMGMGFHDLDIGQERCRGTRRPGRASGV